MSEGNSTLNTEATWEYGNFLEDIDIVVMRRNSYDQDLHDNFKDKNIYVEIFKKI